MGISFCYCISVVDCMTSASLTLIEDRGGGGEEGGEGGREERKK